MFFCGILVLKFTIRGLIVKIFLYIADSQEYKNNTKILTNPFSYCIFAREKNDENNNEYLEP